MDNQLPPIIPVIPQTGSAPGVPTPPAPIPRETVPTQPPVHDATVHPITKKQLFFIVGLGVLGLVLGAGVAFLLNFLGINLVGG